MQQRSTLLSKSEPVYTELRNSERDTFQIKRGESGEYHHVEIKTL